MGFGNIELQAQVLSRRGGRLPSNTALVAMHGSSNQRGSHIFGVGYNDRAVDLGQVRLSGRETCLPSSERPGKQQQEAGSPLHLQGSPCCSQATTYRQLCLLCYGTSLIGELVVYL